MIMGGGIHGGIGGGIGCDGEIGGGGDGGGCFGGVDGGGGSGFSGVVVMYVYQLLCHNRQYWMLL